MRRVRERVKGWLRGFLPPFLLLRFAAFKRGREARRNAGRTPAEVFAEIYRKGVWGVERSFDSGAGSSDASVVGPYIEKLKTELRALGSVKVVDLGCGDFTVSGQLAGCCAEYVGVDVVPELIDHLQAKHSGPHARFVCMDIVEDDPPSGDVCLIRQVLQHLSNKQILKILSKLDRYATVFITEHYPADGASVVYNIDKVQGASTRIYQDSGVYLDRPPFNCSGLEMFLEVPDNSGNRLHPGVLRTFRYRPRMP